MIRWRRGGASCYCGSLLLDADQRAFFAEHGWLVVRGSRLPTGLGYFGYVTGALLIVVYLARLLILDPTSPLVLVPALLAGFVASPIWCVWLGLSLWRNRTGSAGRHL